MDSSLLYRVLQSLVKPESQELHRKQSPQPLEATFNPGEAIPWKSPPRMARCSPPPTVASTTNQLLSKQPHMCSDGVDVEATCPEPEVTYDYSTSPHLKNSHGNLMPTCSATTGRWSISSNLGPFYFGEKARFVLLSP